MKTKKFKDYMNKPLTTSEIAQIERQARLEKRALQTLRKDIARAMRNYMKEENIGFNELVRRLDASPTHVAKIQKGEANLTLASMARIFALIGCSPHLVFSSKK